MIVLWGIASQCLELYTVKIFFEHILAKYEFFTVCHIFYSIQNYFKFYIYKFFDTIMKVEGKYDLATI